MKLAIGALSVLVFTGCAGLSVQWVATATYNTPAVTQTIMSPGVEKDEEKPAAKNTEKSGVEM